MGWDQSWVMAFPLVTLLFGGLRQAIPKSYLCFRAIFASCVIEIDAFIASFPGLKEDLGTKLLSPWSLQSSLVPPLLQVITQFPNFAPEDDLDTTKIKVAVTLVTLKACCIGCLTSRVCAPSLHCTVGQCASEWH